MKLRGVCQPLWCWSGALLPAVLLQPAAPVGVASAAMVLAAILRRLAAPVRLCLAPRLSQLPAAVCLAPAAAALPVGLGSHRPLALPQRSGPQPLHQPPVVCLARQPAAHLPQVAAVCLGLGSAARRLLGSRPRLLPAARQRLVGALARPPPLQHRLAHHPRLALAGLGSRRPLDKLPHLASRPALDSSRLRRSASRLHLGSPLALARRLRLARLRRRRRPLVQQQLPRQRRHLASPQHFGQPSAFGGAAAAGGSGGVFGGGFGGAAQAQSSAGFGAFGGAAGGSAFGGGGSGVFGGAGSSSPLNKTACGR